MISNIDAHGPDKTHGWTRTHNGIVWYWVFDGESVGFTERGTPLSHPIRKTGEIPDAVRDHAEAHIDALIERNELDHY